MDQVALSNNKCPFCFLCDTRSGCWHGMSEGMRLSEICAFIFIWQESSLATVIFVGIGVLLQVRILKYLGVRHRFLHLSGS
jgi:hypothetical protein